jgi:hypothetical protein
MVERSVSTSQLKPSVTAAAAQSRTLLQQSANAGDMPPQAMTIARGRSFEGSYQCLRSRRVLHRWFFGPELTRTGLRPESRLRAL